MTITGKNIIGFSDSSLGTVGIQALKAQTQEPLGPLFFKATEEELQEAISAAVKAYKVYRNISPTKIAGFLESIASEIETLGDALINRYTEESGLPQARALGERGRTCMQLRLFASLLKEGSWVNATIDKAQPERQPLPKPDLRSMERPLGPVVVFGASNFPLAFSVAGGDTASALAAGCPVIFKAHPSHLGTSELVAKAITTAAKFSGMPEGVFSLLFDDGIEIGQKIVQHPDIHAVAFTGSYRGGKAIFDLANQRPNPIPVYAEMGSTNPVFILPKTAQEKGEALAQQYVNSLTMGVGQFCTNPGVLVYQTNPAFKASVKEKAQLSNGGTMLNKGIFTAYNKGVEHLESISDVLAKGNQAQGPVEAKPAVFHTVASDFLSKKDLSEEVFGPSSVMVEASSKADLLDIAHNLDGHLTATVFGSEEELIDYADLLQILEQKVGRLVCNGFPTGVEVTHAMVHGGPFPSTTNARTTSVGTQAITRFTRPVCFQDMPDSLLPDALKNSNPLSIWRKVDGEFKK
ncbi:MAG: aldehyde dehydrogenase (NADP(+)) [Leadbetterella sp.]